MRCTAFKADPAAQVDGRGNALTDYEDPNVPSLLAIPLLGYPSYNRTIYANTRARILSPDNKFFFESALASKLLMLRSLLTQTCLFACAPRLQLRLPLTQIHECERLLSGSCHWRTKRPADMPHIGLWVRGDCLPLAAVADVLLVHSGDGLYGLGSTHTPHGFVWPLAYMIEGLTTSNSTRVAELFTWLLRMQCRNGLMHESVLLGSDVRSRVLLRFMCMLMLMSSLPRSSALADAGT